MSQNSNIYIPTNRRCSYAGCRNNCLSGVALFSFPSGEKNKARLFKWIENSGDSQRMEKFTPSYLKSLKICADHFHESDFISEFKDKLKPTAIPLFYYPPPNRNNDTSDGIGVINQPPPAKKARTTVNEQSNRTVEVSSEIANFNKSGVQILPQSNTSHQRGLLTMHYSQYKDLLKRIQILEKENSILEKNLKMNESVIKKLQKAMVSAQRRRFKDPKRRQKFLKTEALKFIDQMELDPAAKATILLQLHTPNAPYNKAEKDVAKTLHYHSPSALGSLRQQGATYPGKNTIRRWLEEFTITPGFCDSVFTKLEQFLMTCPPKQRLCALKFDETVIKSLEEYTEKFDLIEGLVDKGQFGREAKRAKSVLFLCVDSINVENTWRHPLAYFFTESSMSGDEIFEIILECLTRLEKIGADCRFITCDMGKNNQRLASLLKIKIKRSNKDKRCAEDSQLGAFKYNGKKYYMGYDVPHLFKRVVAYLRTEKPLYLKTQKTLNCDKKIIAKFSDFVETYEIDKRNNSGSRLLSHISEKLHLYPNSFECMNVKRAFQILGRRYAAAMKTAGTANLLTKSTTWKETVNFIERCNDAIDALNTLSNKDEKTLTMKRVMCKRNSDIRDSLLDFWEWTEKWEVSAGSRPDFLDGLPMTIRAIISLYDDLELEFPGFELATGLLDQDSVEHLFSKFRQRGGNNANPSARSIRISTGHILSNGYTYKSIGCNTSNIEDNYVSSFDLDKNVDVIIPTTGMKHQKNKEKNENSIDVIEGAGEFDLLEDGGDDDFGLLEDVDTLFGVQENCEDGGSSQKENNQGNAEQDYQDLDEYAQQAVTYFCGFIARRGLQKHDCDKCRNNWIKTPLDPSTNAEGYIRYREYTLDHDPDDPDVLHLYRPQESLIMLFAVFLKKFDETWEQYWHVCPLLATLVIQFIKFTNECPETKEWFAEDNACYIHRLYFLKYLLKVKIIARTRSHNQDERNAKIRVYVKNNQRLKNLNNF